MSETQPESDAIFGAEALAEFLTEETGRQVKPHQVYYWSERKILPIGRFGNSLIGSRKTIRQKFSQLAGGGRT